VSKNYVFTAKRRVDIYEKFAFVTEHIFSSPCQRQGEFLPSLGVRRPSSFNFLHFNLLHPNRLVK
jgi:hypothetical protein